MMNLSIPLVFYRHSDRSVRKLPGHITPGAPKRPALHYRADRIRRGLLNPDGKPKTPLVLRDCKGSTCAYYQDLQGTSMASPQADAMPRAAPVRLPRSQLGRRPVRRHARAQRLLRRRRGERADREHRLIAGSRGRTDSRRGAAHPGGTSPLLFRSTPLVSHGGRDPRRVVSPAEASGSWWAPRSSKPLRRASPAWRVRFPSASATSQNAAAGPPRTGAGAVKAPKF
jgi:hypothetical protein